jgi:hypothetical protein
MSTRTSSTIVLSFADLARQDAVARTVLIRFCLLVLRVLYDLCEHKYIV